MGIHTRHAAHETYGSARRHTLIPRNGIVVADAVRDTQLVACRTVHVHPDITQPTAWGNR